MELEELANRLGALEAARDADLQAQAQQAFMDKFGGTVSNNRGLGTVILNELSRRGIDTSAADEAVQEIIGQLRMEATALLDATKDYNRVANELMDKLDNVEDSIQSAKESTTGELVQSAEMSPEQLTDEFEDMPDLAAPDTLGMTQEPMPQEPMPQEPMPQEPMPQEPMPQENVAPMNIPSDERIKIIGQYLSDRRLKNVKPANKTKADESCNKLSGNIISACLGGN